MEDEVDMELLLSYGLTSMQSHYGKQFISIADAVNYFYTLNNKEEALAALSVCYQLISKHGNGLDNVTAPGIADKMKEQLINHWNTL